MKPIILSILILLISGCTKEVKVYRQVYIYEKIPSVLLRYNNIPKPPNKVKFKTLKDGNKVNELIIYSTKLIKYIRLLQLKIFTIKKIHYLNKKR